MSFLSALFGRLAPANAEKVPAVELPPEEPGGR